jgi:hypothetical protein
MAWMLPSRARLPRGYSILRLDSITSHRVSPNVVRISSIVLPLKEIKETLRPNGSELLQLVCHCFESGGKTEILWAIGLSSANQLLILLLCDLY